MLTTSKRIRQSINAMRHSTGAKVSRLLLPRWRFLASQDVDAHFAAAGLVQVHPVPLVSRRVFDVHRAYGGLAVQRLARVLSGRVGAPVELDRFVPGGRQPVAVLVDLHRAVGKDEPARLETFAGGE